MTDSRYVNLVRSLPRPSDAQIERFTSYVASAHSWYRHLPLLPPGAPFHFYLNPDAGREWLVTPTGGMYRDRLADAPVQDRFHHAWQPTHVYIDCFGYLDYFADAGTAFLVPQRGGILDTRSLPRIQGRAGEWVDLPEEVRAAGSVSLTAAIHELGQEPFIWLSRLGKLEKSSWGRGDTLLPRRRLDDEVAAAIVNLLRTIPDPPRGWIGRMRRAMTGSTAPRGDDATLSLPACAELKTRWLPSYAAQQRLQIDGAIRRMLERIYDPPSPVRRGTEPPGA